MRLNRRQRPDAVAQLRRLLEIEGAARLIHPPGQIFLDAPAVAGEEGARLGDQRRIGGLVDVADARRRAALDLVQQARPRAPGEHRIRARAQQERPLQRRQRLVHRPRRGKRAEAGTGTHLRPAMLEHLRERMVAGDENGRKRLVVAQEDVVPGLQALDQIGLEQQRLRLGVGGDELHRLGLGDHPVQPRAQTRRLQIARHPLLQAPRLADVEDAALAVEHPVDAGSGGQRRQQIGNQRRPASRLGCRLCRGGMLAGSLWRRGLRRSDVSRGGRRANGILVHDFYVPAAGGRVNRRIRRRKITGNSLVRESPVDNLVDTPSQMRPRSLPPVGSGFPSGCNRPSQDADGKAFFALF